MKTKEYKFKEGFIIKPRQTPDGVVFAMGETYVCESTVYDLYEGKQFVETYDTFDDAKQKGVELYSEERLAEA